MSTTKINRLEICEQIASKKIAPVEAASLLGLSRHQVIRLFKHYKQFGAKGLLSQRREQPSNNQLSTTTKAQALNLIQT